MGNIKIRNGRFSLDINPHKEFYSFDYIVPHTEKPTEYEKAQVTRRIARIMMSTRDILRQPDNLLILSEHQIIFSWTNPNMARMYALLDRTGYIFRILKGDRLALHTPHKLLPEDQGGKVLMMGHFWNLATFPDNDPAIAGIRKVAGI